MSCNLNASRGSRQSESALAAATRSILASRATPAATAAASAATAASGTRASTRHTATATPAAAASAAAAAAAVAASVARSSRQTATAAAGSGLSRSATFSHSSRAATGGAAFTSAIEQAIVNAKVPLPMDVKDTIQVGQYRGLHLNKSEDASFQGPRPLSQYKFNDDSNPEILKKRLDAIKYVQEIAVRHLNPPPAPKPGDLIIREKQSQIPPAPPVVIRQEGQGAKTPAPLVYRQAPPRLPTAIPEQVVEIEGAPIDPPARRVVVETFPNAPAKPQNILIEKWLPYQAQKRRVVFQKSCAQAPANPRNLIIEWEQPCAQVEKVCKDLGVVDADPEEYRRQYGAELKDEVPNLCEEERGCGAKSGAASAAKGGLAGLEGDLDALKRVDLDKYGLSEYRRFIQ